MTEAGALREVMGRFPTGVTVVGASTEDGSPYGLTVNSLTSVSLDPPLVLVCIDREASSHDRLLEAGSFTISVLASHQAEVARRFAAEPSPRRFDDVAWTEGPGGDPVVEGAAAWLACSIETVHPGGDHSILVGKVTQARTGVRDALVFYRGGFAAVTA